MATIISMWFMLQADINEEKDLPKNEWNPEWYRKTTTTRNYSNGI